MPSVCGRLKKHCFIFIQSWIEVLRLKNWSPWAPAFEHLSCAEQINPTLNLTGRKFCFFLCQVTKMLVTLVVVFALCWLPLHLFTLILDLAPHLLDGIKTQSDERLFLGIYYSCHWLAMANSFANPIIYCFLNDSFRVSVSASVILKFPQPTMKAVLSE